MEIVSKSECSGCGACKAICPVKCISMIEESGGFLYPCIDTGKCINCRKCYNVCSSRNIKKNDYVKKIYAVSSKNSNMLRRSSSGGVMGELSKYVISRGGVVFGCAYDSNLYAINIAAKNEDEIRLFHGSKYLQSNTKDTFAECRGLLDDGTEILYTGTPCQIAGLKNYLGKEYDNLLTAEIICHGVPSGRLWRSYLDRLESRFGKKIVDINQRYQDMGWCTFRLWIQFEDGEETVLDEWNEPYFKAFIKELTMRKSCYSCKNRISYSRADILAGDFWGIEKFNHRANVEEGVSFVAVLSDKGKEAIENIDFDIQSSELKEATPRNACIISSAFPHRWTDQFYEDFDKGINIDVLVEKYADNYKWERNKPSFALWGSYNISLIIRFLQNMTGDWVFHVSNSSVVSAMDKTTLCAPDVRLDNLYRKTALEKDFTSGFLSLIEKDYVGDYFVMDLLEERFGLCRYNGKIITDSDAFNDVKSQLKEKSQVVQIDRKTALDGFMQTLLKRYAVGHIIIIENYLCDRYVTPDGFIAFEDNRGIEQVNQNLRKLYSFLKQKYSDIIYIKLSRDKLYSDINHRYGALPENMSYESCYAVADRIYQAIMEDTGK